MFMKIGHNIFVHEKTSNSFIIREASKANNEYVLGHKRFCKSCLNGSRNYV